MAQEEVLGIVDPAMLQRAKQMEDHPEIRVYSIGHEGESNLHLPGIGTKTITWVQAAVRWIGDKLHLGTAVFDRHDPTTNSHVGRQQIGEVVGKVTKQIGDRLNTLAAIHIFPKYKSKPLDVASFEAEIEYDHDGTQAWPTRVDNVSGIALSNSGVDSPGFPGATLMGAVQAAVQAFSGEMDATTMNLSEVKTAVQELKLSPTQIFDIGDIMGDSTVAAKVKGENKDTYAMAQRVREERDEARERAAKLENESAEKDQTISRQTMQSKSAATITSIIDAPERKLSAKAKLFIKRQLNSFTATATDEAALKTELSTFVDKTATEYGEIAKELGIKDDAVLNTRPGLTLPANMLVDGQLQTVDSKNAFTPPPSRDEVLAAEMDPATNPLIPGGAAAKEALSSL